MGGEVGENRGRRWQQQELPLQQRQQRWQASPRVFNCCFVCGAPLQMHTARSTNTRSHPINT